MPIQPYVFFDGRCDEAINFYKKAMGAEVQMLMRFKDNPDGANCPGGQNVPPDAVMHASINIGGTTILVSDGMAGGNPKFEGFSLSLTVPSEDCADKAFAALTSEGGRVDVPLNKTFFSPRFGMCADKFGVNWMVYVAPPEGK